MRLYVGNLSYQTTEEDLQEAFSQFGTVQSVAIIKDKFSGESRGFGFVEMSTHEEGEAAIAKMDGTELGGRRLTVNEARPQRDDRRGRGDGGNRPW